MTYGPRATAPHNTGGQPASAWAWVGQATPYEPGLIVSPAWDGYDSYPPDGYDQPRQPYSYPTGAQDYPPGPGWDDRAPGLADQILSAADAQATEVWDDARERAAELRADAEHEASAVSKAARREAEELLRRARAEAETILNDAAEQAAELRASVRTMTDDLGRVAAYISEHLATPGMATGPAVLAPQAPPAAPLAPPAAPLAPPAAAPGPPASARGLDARPRRSGRAKAPARGGIEQKRQNFYKGVGALVLLSVLGIGLTVNEIRMNGVQFFLFRNAGAGAGNSQNLNEDQGPGQPNAPGARHIGTVQRPGTPVTSNPGQGQRIGGQQGPGDTARALPPHPRRHHRRGTLPGQTTPNQTAPNQP